MALSDIYMLKHFQDFMGQECLNVYFYERVVGTGGAVNLASDWASEILPLVNGIQSSNVDNVDLDVSNLGSTTDFDLYILTGSGELVAESLPAFNAVSYTFKSDDRAVRHGGKRYVGIPEAETVVNDITNADYLTRMEALRDGLFDPLVGAANTWRPVLVKRIKVAVPDTDPVRYTYRLPHTGDPLVVAGLLAVLVSNKVRHQISRQT